MVEKKENVMRKIRLEKVTLNMGVGEAGDELKKAEKILNQIADVKPVHCRCRIKLPTWEIRPGLPIGVKATLRKAKAVEFLKRALQAKDNKLRRKSFDRQGNFGFGIKEYIDLPGVKYDPKLGIKGLDVLVTLERPGYRIKKRKLKKTRMGKSHLISQEEARQFIKETFGVEIA